MTCKWVEREILPFLKVKCTTTCTTTFFTRSKTIYQHIREGSCFLGSLVRKFIKVKKSNGVCLQKIMRFEIMSNEIGI